MACTADDGHLVPRFVMRPDDVTTAEAGVVLLLCAANGRDRHDAAPRISWLKDGSLLDTA